MKKFFTRLFVFFGVLFFLEIILGAYIWLADPFNLKPILSSSLPNSNASSESTFDHPLLNSTQEAVLSGLGVDVANLPSEVTPAMETCLIAKVGTDRAQEIMNGALPNLLDIAKAKSCLSE